ncbi:MAG: glycosyltransferase [candidate division Zixibacteria bacterium]|nr:glycosyltransferase [candidate division Zixibacteria bacterium]
MKVLVLADVQSWHTPRFVNGLRSEGVVVTLASLQDGKGVDYKFSRSRLGEFASYVLMPNQISELIETNNPDIVSSHFASAYGFSAALARKRYTESHPRWSLHVWGSDILVSPHRSFLHRRRISYALGGADLILADSSYLKKKTMELGGCEVSVCPWGVEKEFVPTPAEISSKSIWGKGSPVKVILPRPHNKIYRNEIILKELSDALRAKKISLIVSSQGDSRRDFEILSQKLDVDKRIEYYNPMQRREYLEMFGGNSIVISAARSDSSPVTLIEAMALGVAPIFADHPGLYDFLNPKDSQEFIFDSTSPGDLARKLNHIVDMKSGVRGQLLLKNHQTVLRRGIYEENIRTTINIWERSLHA